MAPDKRLLEPLIWRSAISRSIRQDVEISVHLLMISSALKEFRFGVACL
jgi:hypothetical protein